jgi:hypothetical protein
MLILDERCQKIPIKLCDNPYHATLYWGGCTVRAYFTLRLFRDNARSLCGVGAWQLVANRPMRPT